MLAFNRSVQPCSLDFGDETIDTHQFPFPDDGVIYTEDGNQELVAIPETPADRWQRQQQHVGGGGPAGQSVHDMIESAGIRLSDQSKESITALYPHCSRHFNGDFDSYLLVNWEKCSAKQIFDICASPHMQCGQTKSMAWVMKHAVHQLTGPLSCFCQKVLTPVLPSICA
jgi:hypothetical protein